MVKHNLAISFIFLTFGVLFGQKSFDQRLDTVEIIRMPTPSSQTGRNISVISQEEIEALPFTSLDDLLQYIPGVEVQSRNAFGVQGDITIRGTNFTQVLLLMDGVRINDPLTGHFNSNLPVTPDEIYRIEILRGSAAAMYGADAVGGVINIITKVFTASSPKDNDLSARILYGKEGLVAARQGFYLKQDKMTLGGGFNLAQSDGEFIPGKTVSSNELEGYNNFFDIKTVGLAMAYQLSDSWTIRGRTAYDDQDFSARYFYTASPLDKSTETTRNWWNQLQLDNINQYSRTSIQLAYKYNTDEFTFSPDFPSTNRHTTQLGQVLINHFREISTNFSASLGIQVDRRAIESNDRGDHQDLHVGAYAIGAYQTDKLALTGSLRLDYDENYNWEFSPMINFAYMLPKLVFRGSLGRNIRAADYTERYVSTNLENLSPGRNLGNPNLVAEQGWSQELGTDIYINSHLTLKATAFFRQASNLIDYVSTNEREITGIGSLQDSANYLFAQNITDVDTRGFEIEAWYRHAWGKEIRINGSIGYTHLNTTNEEEIISVYISSHARHLLTTQWLFQNRNWEIGVNGLYKVREERGAESIDSRLEQSYSIWNFRAAAYIQKPIGLNFQVHNAFDVSYQDILGAAMPGRWFMGGLICQF